jgi:hypothetical protein
MRARTGRPAAFRVYPAVCQASVACRYPRLTPSCSNDGCEPRQDSVLNDKNGYQTASQCLRCLQCELDNTDAAWHICCGRYVSRPQLAECM